MHRRAASVGPLRHRHRIDRDGGLLVVAVAAAVVAQVLLDLVIAPLQPGIAGERVLVHRVVADVVQRTQLPRRAHDQLLAAALDHRPITDVYTWLTRPTDETAVDILREHDFALTADQVAGVVSAPGKQRGGIFGTAMQMASCLTNRQVARWVTRFHTLLDQFWIVV